MAKLSFTNTPSTPPRSPSCANRIHRFLKLGPKWRSQCQGHRVPGFWPFRDQGSCTTELAAVEPQLCCGSLDLLLRVVPSLEHTSGSIITTEPCSLSLEIMVSKGNHPKMAQPFRLVNYYNLPTHIYININPNSIWPHIPSGYLT